MSLYQYYGFQALDRPLTAAQMNELRRYSSRATITPTSFVNEYDWGDFKGDEIGWMAKYFDAFLYLSSAGVRVVRFRVPAARLDAAVVRRYCGGDDVVVRGDLRAHYLAWLLRIETQGLRGSVREPPVPAGLERLSTAQKGLADFLRVDPDLLRAAAVGSRTLAHPSHENALRARVAGLQSRQRLIRTREDARGRYLDSLVGRETKLWAKIGKLVSGARAADYDEAVNLLVDLRDLEIHRKGRGFARRLETLRREYVRRPALLRRLEKAGL